MGKVVVPEETLTTAIELITIGCDQRVGEVELLSNAQTNSVAEQDLTFSYSRISTFGPGNNGGSLDIGRSRISAMKVLYRESEARGFPAIFNTPAEPAEP